MKHKHFIIIFFTFLMFSQYIFTFNFNTQNQFSSPNSSVAHYDKVINDTNNSVFIESMINPLYQNTNATNYFDYVADGSTCLTHGWTVAAGYTPTTNTVDHYWNHRGCMYVSRSNAGSTGILQYTYTIDDTIDNYIEYEGWFYIPNAYVSYMYMMMHDGSEYIGGFSTSSTTIQYWNGVATASSGLTFTRDEWHYFRVVFREGTTSEIYIDDNQYFTHTGDTTTSTTLNMWFGLTTVTGGSYVMLDSLSCNLDPDNYRSGMSRNINNTDEALEDLNDYEYLYDGTNLNPYYRNYTLNPQEYRLAYAPQTFNEYTHRVYDTNLNYLGFGITTYFDTEFRISELDLSEYNVELFSESDQITEWRFDQPTEIYNENFSNWEINTTNLFSTNIASYFGYIRPSHPDTAFPNDIWIDTSIGFVQKNATYGITNIFEDHFLNMTLVTRLINGWGYDLEDFVEIWYSDDDIDYPYTWNTALTKTWNFLEFFSLITTGLSYNYIYLENFHPNYRLGFNSSKSATSYDDWTGAVSPYFIVNYTKFLQTDHLSLVSTTESINISKNLNLDLVAGDIIEFTTNNDGNLDYDLVLEEESQSYSGSGTNTYYYTIQNDISNATLSFLVEMEDSKNFQLTSLTLKRSKVALNQSVDIFYLNPYGSLVEFVSIGEYSVLIYENEELQQIQTVNITSLWSITNIYYQKTGDLECQISFYDDQENFLEFDLFRSYLTRTLFSQTKSYLMTSNRFYADSQSNYSLYIYDRFDNLLYSAIDQVVEQFIDIQISVFTLKIQNKMQIDTNITIATADYSFNELVVFDEILTFKLYPTQYNLSYLDESESSQTIELNITSDYLVILNTSYHQVYFAFFSDDGLGLSSELFRFYLNNVRKDGGFNWIFGSTVDIFVQDYFNQTLIDQTITTTTITEYNIYLPVYTLFINNNYTDSMQISIEHNSIEFKQIIAAQAGIQYRFLANITYEIKIYYTNGTLAEEKVITLDENNKIVNFGYYTEIIPATPEQIQNEMQDILLIAFWAVVFVATFAILYINIKKKTDRNATIKDRKRKIGVRNETDFYN